MPTDTAEADTDSPAYAHPGLGWLNAVACRPDRQDNGSGDFFVAAGKVISERARTRCRFQCPVRRECVLHAYLGGIEGGPIDAAYFGGFSAGERRAMTLEDALSAVERDRSAGRKGQLL